MASVIVPTGNFAVYSVDTTEDQQPLSFSGVVLLSPAIQSTLLDLSSDQRFGDRQFTPRRIWVDNSQSGIPIQILVQGTGQLLAIKANTQGIYVLLAQDAESGANFKATISGAPAQTVAIPIQILNAEITPFVWATA